MKDQTRCVSQDARRAIVLMANSVAPKYVKALKEIRDLPMEDAYAGRSEIELYVGAKVTDELRDELKTAWAWPEAESAEEFYTRYPFLRPDSRLEKHYAERLFFQKVLQKVLLRNLGAGGLARLEAQVPFKDENGKQRYIDFVLRGAEDYAIEVEGATHHDEALISGNRWVDEKVRQRSIPAAGYVYKPFAYREIEDGTAFKSFGKLCDSDEVLSATARLRFQKGDPLHRAAVELVQNTPVLLRQLYLVAASHLARAAAGAEVRLAIRGDESGLVAMAFADILSLYRTVATLRGEPQALPRVALSYGPDWEPTDSALGWFFNNPNWARDRRDLRVDALAPGAFVLDASREGVPFALSWPLKEGREQWESVRVSLARPAKPTAWVLEKPVLDSLARWFFPEVVALHPEQAVVVASLMKGESRMVILPTAYGKSLCFQLPALVLPGLLLVICPLGALMRDQIESLRSNGIAAAINISSMDDATTKSVKLQRVSAGGVRLLYVSPERVLVKTFVDEVAANSRTWGVWAIAIDEAHCVSEWGHDFRPSYLHIPAFKDRLALHRPVAMVALTGTASELVEQDVLSILEIDQPAIRLRSSDRKEISFSTHAAVHSERPATIGAVISEHLPRVLKRTANELYRAEEPQGVVIFAPYASPRGTTTRQFGVLSIKRALVASGALKESEVRVHASSVITVCPSPKCESTQFKGFRAPFKCLDCGLEFQTPKPILPGNWLDQMAETQDAFKRSEFPMLVATKGYGMGIDKRNIRGIVHASFAGGLESYYQEVGRAARDKQHGHAALVFTPPVPECEAIHLRGEGASADFLKRIEPPCITEAGNYKYWKCPYKLPALCDFGLQARFIKVSYPGEAEDLAAVMKIYQKLAESSGDEVKWFMDADAESNGPQVAVYRLMQVGFVKDYVVDYSRFPRPNLIIRRAAGWTVDIGHTTAVAHLKRLAHGVIGRQDWEVVDTQIDAEVAGVPASSPRDAVQALVTLLLTRTYEAVKTMRYRMLENQWRFATTDGCRRSHIRAAFDGMQIEAGDGCGFCDSCVPSMDFKQSHARVPVEDAALIELSTALPEIIERFDVAEVDDLLKRAKEHDALRGLQLRAEHLLESTPENQGALFVAGAAAVEQGSPDDALLRLGEAAALNDRQTRDRSRGEAYYRRARRADIARALDIIDHKGGVFDDRAGRVMVSGELAKILAADDPRRQRMGQIVACDELDEALPVQALKSTRLLLAGLLEELAA